MNRIATFCAVSCLVIAIPTLAQARAARLSPTQVITVVNPLDEQDVRLLLQFELPSDCEPSKVVMARFQMTVGRIQETPLAVESIESSWHSNDTWQSLSGKGVIDVSKVRSAPEARAVSNRLVDEDEDSSLGGYDCPVTDFVRNGRSATIGLMLRRDPQRSDDVSRAVTAESISSCRLVVLYTR